MMTCSRAVPVLRSHGGVDDVEQLVQGHGGGPGEVGALVPGRVGDDEVVGGGQEGVEEELAVLGAGVVVADVRVGGDEVVAVALEVAGEDAVVEAEQADHPVGDRPHRDERADRQVAGAEVRPRRAASQAVGEKSAHVGRAQLDGAHPPGGGGLVHEVVEEAAEAAVAARRPARRSPSRRRRCRRARSPRRRPAVSRRGGRGAVEAVDQLGQPAGQLDVAAVHVVERQGATEEPLALVGHGHAEQSRSRPARQVLASSRSSLNAAR